MMKTILITGTDTEVGKTVLTTSLIAYGQTFCPQQTLGLMKLIQTGVGDKELYRQLFPSISIVNPLSFSHPLAPPIAASKEGLEVNLAPVWQALTTIQQEQDLVVVEALGGLGSPVTYEFTVADIARDWRLPTVLVVPVKLGAIAQAVANVMLARYYNINLLGIVLNCVSPCTSEQIADLTPMDLISTLTNVPILGIIPHLNNPTDVNKLAHIAANLDLVNLMFW